MSNTVWVFHASENRGRVLRVLVLRYVNDLGVLLPWVDSDDPLAALEAELTAEAQQVDTISGQPDFERFFPLALADTDQAQEFRRRAVTGQARNRLAAAQRVLAALGEGTASRVAVDAEDIDAWVQVLSAIRVQWYVELTGTSDRLTEPTAEDLDNAPETAALLDWLALLIEDAVQSKWRHLSPGEA